MTEAARPKLTRERFARPGFARQGVARVRAGCGLLLLATMFGLADAAHSPVVAEPVVVAQARPPVPPGSSPGASGAPAARAQALTSAGIAAYRAGRHQEAVQLYTQSLALKSDQAPVYYNRGLAHYQLRNYAAARDDLTRAIQINPSDPDSFIWRADALRMLNDPDRALADIERVLTMSPRHKLALVRRGDLRKARGDFDGADKDYSTAFEVDPKFTYAIYLRANLRRVHLRNEEAALEDYSTAIALNAQYVPPLSERAAMLLHRGDYAGAVADYARLIQLQPGVANWRNQRAWSYFKNKEAAKGLPDAEMAVRMDARNADYIDTRAHIHEAMGARDKALADFRAALKLNPGLRDSQAGLRRLEMSNAGPSAGRGITRPGASSRAAPEGPRPAEQASGPYDASAPPRGYSGGPRAQ